MRRTSRWLPVLVSCPLIWLSGCAKGADAAGSGGAGGDQPKSERLFVQCSGDAGANWTSLTPNPWPQNQSACATSYCSGYTSSRAFGWTAQSISLPTECRNATTRFRFRAEGQSAWRLQNPGWYVDTVTIN